MVQLEPKLTGIWNLVTDKILREKLGFIMSVLRKNDKFLTLYSKFHNQTLTNSISLISTSPSCKNHRTKLFFAEVAFYALHVAIEIGLKQYALQASWSYLNLISEFYTVSTVLIFRVWSGVTI